MQLNPFNTKTTEDPRRQKFEMAWQVVQVYQHAQVFIILLLIQTEACMLAAAEALLLCGCSMATWQHGCPTI